MGTLQEALSVSCCPVERPRRRIQQLGVERAVCHRQRWYPSSGFTFIELLFSLFIFSIGFVALLEAMAYSLRSAIDIQHSLQAGIILEDVAQQLQTISVDEQPARNHDWLYRMQQREILPEGEIDLDSRRNDGIQLQLRWPATIFSSGQSAEYSGCQLANGQAAQCMSLWVPHSNGS